VLTPVKGLDTGLVVDGISHFQLVLLSDASCLKNQQYLCVSVVCLGIHVIAPQSGFFNPAIIWGNVRIKQTLGFFIGDRLSVIPHYHSNIVRGNLKGSAHVEMFRAFLSPRAIWTKNRLMHVKTASVTPSNVNIPQFIPLASGESDFP
jgi:hypothetical protein